MGKSYLAEEELRQYLLRAANVDGIQRQCSPQKDYIFHATCTPNLNMPDNDPGLGKACLGKRQKEIEWVVEHARQLTRMLPGGLCVIGVFLLCGSEMEEDVQGTLRKAGKSPFALCSRSILKYMFTFAFCSMFLVLVSPLFSTSISQPGITWFEYCFRLLFLHSYFTISHVPNKKTSWNQTKLAQLQDALINP
uniref:Protein odr-4 homolog n=1 Tax=Eptatretus burgeri TaxID=7764 RepID=A0A8C4WY88_EPTBU